MDRLDYGCALDEVVERPDRSRHRLLKELQEIDNNFDYDIDTIQL